MSTEEELNLAQEDQQRAARKADKARAKGDADTEEFLTRRSRDAIKRTSRLLREDEEDR